MKLVSKDIFLNAIACPTLGWLKRSGDINEMLTEVSPAEKFRMEQGLEIGKRARTVFPEGILVNDNSLASSVEMTAALLNNPKSSVIFEGTFIVDNFVAKADILKRSGKSWKLIEVKSSVNDKEEFTDDMAYTFMVASRCNIPISKVTLMPSIKGL